MMRVGRPWWQYSNGNGNGNGNWQAQAQEQYRRTAIQEVLEDEALQWHSLALAGSGLALAVAEILVL